MRLIKWLVWDIHQPKLRPFTTTVAIIATIPWLTVSVMGWISIFGG